MDEHLSALYLSTLINNNNNNDNNNENNNKMIHAKIAEYLTNPTEKFILIDTKLDELPESMKSIETLKYLSIENCNLKSLTNIPLNLETLEANNNNIDNIDLSMNSIKNLNLSKNILKNIIFFPYNVKMLDLSLSEFNNVETLQCLTNLKILNLNNTKVSYIDNLPDWITNLSASNLTLLNSDNMEGVIKKLPASLTHFESNGSKLKSFDFKEFPENLIHIDVKNNELQHIPIISNNAKHVDLSINSLVSVANIPMNVNLYDVSKNKSFEFTKEQNSLIEIIINSGKKPKQKIPTPILKAIANDGFVPTKNPLYKIKHDHIYYV